MGCRGNIEIIHPKLGVDSGEVSIFLYTHWGGETVCQDLAQALDDGRSRWSDPDYLTRIIFNQLQGDNRDLTGFGIGIHPAGDAEFPVPALYWTTREGRFGQEPTEEPLVMYEDDILTADEFIDRFLPPAVQVIDHVTEPTLEIKELL